MKLLRDLFRLCVGGHRVLRARRRADHRVWHVTVPAPRDGGELRPCA